MRDRKLVELLRLRRLLEGVMILVLCSFCVASTTQAQEKSPQFDFKAFDERRTQSPQLPITSKMIENERRRRDDLDTRARVDVLLETFKRDRAAWHAEKQRMHDEMQEALRQASRDAIIYAWAEVFDLLGSLALTYAQMIETQADVAEAKQAPPSKQNDQGKTPRVPSTPPVKGPHYKLKQQGTQTIEWCPSETTSCRIIEHHEILKTMVLSGGRTSAASGRVAPAAAEFVREGASLLGTLPNLRCIESERSCFVSQEMSGAATNPGSAFTPEKSKIDPVSLVFSKKERELFSLLVDFAPGVTTGKSVLEVVMGHDPITGEAISRPVSLIGLAASLAPGGKLFLKSLVKGNAKIAIANGKKHSGLLKNYAKRSVNEVQKAIDSLKKQTARHRDKIKHPSNYLPDFKKLRSQHQESLTKGWKREIKTFSEQIDVLNGLLKEGNR